jgi:hypothetical protein
VAYDSGSRIEAKLSFVIENGNWRWPLGRLRNLICKQSMGAVVYNL